MKKGQFSSKETGQTKDVQVESLGELMLAKVKDFLLLHRKTGTVKEWNELREQLKLKLPEAVIGLLDASAFIDEFVTSK